MNIKLKQEDICRRDTYTITYQENNYEVMVVFTEGKDGKTVHAKFYLIEDANDMFFFEVDREGELAEEDDCIRIGYELIENNFIDFMESLGYINDFENESDNELEL